MNSEKKINVSTDPLIIFKTIKNQAEPHFLMLFKDTGVAIEDGSDKQIVYVLFQLQLLTIKHSALCPIKTVVYDFNHQSHLGKRFVGLLLCSFCHDN
ncbi:CLUMA_CG020031, isoform A [Clunio marinus]|uniref:CLUMA_CG020031, isoform A n=1 Tax=Clunio marinus TaxID=568069 RepID=A0A1J1J3R5_9DIPT|nr:CLUMA_CG020031, isoform A [Clunio marinus]